MSTSSASPDVGSPNKPMSLESYVGFDTIAKQKEKKLVKRGFTFNIMVVGELFNKRDRKVGIAFC